MYIQDATVTEENTLKVLSPEKAWDGGSNSITQTAIIRVSVSQCNC